MPSSSPSMSWNEPQCRQRHWLSLHLMVRFLNPFFSFSARKKRTVSNYQEKKEGTVPTVVPEFSQNISIFSRPSRRSLPSERASRSARAFRKHLLCDSNTAPCRGGRPGPPAFSGFLRPLQFYRIFPNSIRRGFQGRSALGRAGESREPTERFSGRLFLFFTGRGDSFLSPKREREEWGRKRSPFGETKNVLLLEKQKGNGHLCPFPIL